MRTLDIGFAAHLASGATTLANCWKITRTDTAVLGFTDHDQPLSFAGTDYLPMLDGGEMPARLGGQIDPPQAGQVILFQLGRTSMPKHCGIAIADDRFIHAQEGRGVVEAYLTDGWRKRIAATFDFPDA